MNAALISPANLDLIARLAGDGPVLVALSGGGDSMALLLALRDALGPTRLRAMIVDHALRQGSADDADLARQRAEAAGVAADIIRVDWPNGPKPSQASARQARYRGLCEAARAHDARLIALGHNADDQAETIMLRAEAGASWRGLAGMRAVAPAPIWPEGRGIALIRPLLDQRRADLRVWLEARGAAWIEDPSNANRDFARVRMRQTLSGLEADGFEIAPLLMLAAGLGPRAAAQDAEALNLLRAACRLEAGEARLERALWAEAEESVRLRALSVVLAATAGAAHEPAAGAVARLGARMLEADFSGAALGGSVVSPVKQDWIFRRDSGALLGRADGGPGLAPRILPPDTPIVWDGRLELTAREPGWAVFPGPRQGAPMLERADAALDLDAAAGRVEMSWLLGRHMTHLLGEISSAFTPS